MAFDPNYAANGKFYLNFTVPGGAFGNGVTHVSQFTVSGNPNIADPASERILLTFDHPQANHNGGWIGFSPRAGDARICTSPPETAAAQTTRDRATSNRAAMRKV